MTGPLANEFAQVREAMDMGLQVWRVNDSVRPKFHDAFAALARIEERTHNTEKALRELAETSLHGDISWEAETFGDALVAAIKLGHALSAGEGTPA